MGREERDALHLKGNPVQLAVKLQALIVLQALSLHSPRLEEHEVGVHARGTSRGTGGFAGT